MADSNDGQGHKENFDDTSGKILSQKCSYENSNISYEEVMTNVLLNNKSIF